MLIVQEAHTECGIGAEIVRRVVAEGFDFLDCPPIVIGSKNCPTPFSPVLEDAVIPSIDEIMDKIMLLKQCKI
jgi:pyruvate dehydrogenase E1 component beta subunit